MSAISSLSSSFGFRPTQGANLPGAQRGANSLQSQGAQRGTTYGASSAARGSGVNTASAARGGSASAAYCPTCGNSNSGPYASSYCPNCNTAGGRQSSVTGNLQNYNSTVGGRGQGGAVCVACSYQGR